MKSMRKAMAFSLKLTLAFSPVLEAVAQGGSLQEAGTGKVIVISEKVGETIDLNERNHYRLFLFSQNFQSAVILQLPDSSFVAQITEEKEGIEQLQTVPIDRQTIFILRKYIDDFEKLTPSDKLALLKIKESKNTGPENLTARMTEARRQAKTLMKEKWDKKWWREETQNDLGTSYRTSGMLVGFLAGSAAGMLIGKGFQGKKVVRQEYHEGGWGSGPWTENFYSYKSKYAPHWGAAIGGVGGAVAGYCIGKKADKEYYILVPREIRMEKTKSSWFVNFLGGFGFTGLVMGGITGLTLYTPMTGTEGKLDFGPECVGGYLAGSILGTSIVAGLIGRNERMRLWEDSILEQKPESLLDIRFVPMDPEAFCVLPKKLPSGETFYEYRMDLMRIRF
jgi:hypothetical protein